MIYEYYCEKCDKVIEKDCKPGCPDKTVKCDKCKGICERHYSGLNFKCEGPGANLKLKNEMTKKNEEAGRRGKKKWPDAMPKLVRQ